MENKNKSEFCKRIEFGLDLVAKKLIEQKRRTNGKIAILVDDKIVIMKP
jgi:hypothetical protein